MGDSWNSEELRLGIASKEMLAICRGVKSSPLFVHYCQVHEMPFPKKNIFSFNSEK